MIEEAEYHATREAQARVFASSLVEGAARERHLALADRHAERASLIRHGLVGDTADVSATKNAARNGTHNSLSQAIDRSRELLAESHRILAESREGRSPKD